MIKKPCAPHSMMVWTDLGPLGMNKTWAISMRYRIILARRGAHVILKPQVWLPRASWQMSQDRVEKMTTVKPANLISWKIPCTEIISQNLIGWYQCAVKNLPASFSSFSVTFKSKQFPNSLQKCAVTSSRATAIQEVGAVWSSAVLVDFWDPHVTSPPVSQRSINRELISSLSS